MDGKSICKLFRSLFQLTSASRERDYVVKEVLQEFLCDVQPALRTVNQRAKFRKLRGRGHRGWSLWAKLLEVKWVIAVHCLLDTK
jgi:hypothetical protein